MTTLTPTEQKVLTWRTDFEAFARDRLKIRNKAGELVPFILNAAQQELHSRLETQRLEKGWVRALALKGRQQGVSTYVAARYYWKAVLWAGRNVYLLSHEQTSSDTLFDMVDRFHRNDPFAPHIGVSNAKELLFDKLEASYAVATAGQKAVGRGKALSLFHGSEAAFWANAKDHFAASVQGVPLAKDTEVILESTSAGPLGEFYERCQMAQQGLGDYQMIFLRWTLQSEYSRTPEAGFTLSKESEDGELSEAEYAELHKVSLSQMAWRRAKVLELRDPALFRREYPIGPEEAFSDTGADAPYIAATAVLRARKRTIAGAGPLIIGVDPASGGGDRFAIAFRRGSEIKEVLWRKKVGHLEGVAWIKDILDTHKPARMNIDLGSVGSAIVSTLKAMGPKYAEVVRGINFGGTSQAKLARPKVPGPRNRRAEMFMRLKEWFAGEVAIPDRPELQSDICAPRLKPLPSNDFLLESKTDMRTRHLPSCDLGDACALTFASTEFFPKWAEASGTPVIAPIDPASAVGYTNEDGGSGASWMGF